MGREDSKRSASKKQGSRKTDRWQKDARRRYEDEEQYETGYMGEEAAAINAGNTEDNAPAESADSMPDSMPESTVPASSDGPASSDSAPASSDSTDPTTQEQEQEEDVGSEPEQGAPSEAPASSDDGPAASSSGGPESTADGPAASTAAGPESTVSASSMPDSLQSSSGPASTGPEGSSSDAYMRKIALKKGAQSRYQMYLMANMFEQACKEMLKKALEGGPEKRQALELREQLIKALHYLRYMADVDDEFTQEEYESEMLRVKKFRQKINRLAAKEEEFVDSSASSSSSEDNENVDEDMELLKEARKQMEFAFGKTEK